MYLRKGNRRRGLSGVSTNFSLAVPRRSLGSLGATDEPDKSTLSDPTISDVQWRANVIGQLQAGVATLKHAELQKWLQIAATLLIPVSTAIWKAFVKSSAATSSSE